MNRSLQPCMCVCVCVSALFCINSIDCVIRGEAHLLIHCRHLDLMFISLSNSTNCFHYYVTGMILATNPAMGKPCASVLMINEEGCVRMGIFAKSSMQLIRNVTSVTDHSGTGLRTTTPCAVFKQGGTAGQRQRGGGGLFRYSKRKGQEGIRGG